MKGYVPLKKLYHGLSKSIGLPLACEGGGDGRIRGGLRAEKASSVMRSRK
jgi:hypothetical protein